MIKIEFFSNINIKEEITSLKNKLTVAEDKLKSYPEGSLCKQTRNGKAYYFLVTYKGGKKVRKIASEKNGLLPKLAQKKYLQKEIKILNNNIDLLKSIEKKYVYITPNNILDSLSHPYSNLDRKLFFLSECIDLTNNNIGIWNTNEAAYEQSDYKSEQKTIYTTFGLLVRSKSEALIAEQLLEYSKKYEIEFHYEQVLHTIDGKKYIPDFTIKAPNGNIYYWEHCGMTSNYEYMKKHNKKIKDYETYGIVPWKNLIVTYDDENGNINMKIVKHEIEGKLI